jgi:hypothetical protein
MQKNHCFLCQVLLIWAFTAPFAASSYAANPIITTTYTADPSPHQWSDGKYYMYCSHDQDADVAWDMVDYHVFSSTNLVNWTDNGIAFRNTDSPWLDSGNLWAPDCAERNGKYYLYYPQKSVIGVATSSSPTGYFKNAKLLYSGPTNSQWVYDPMVFTDDDNQAYLIVSACMKSGGFKPILLKLGSDMMSVTEETILSTTGGFHEGPWLFKQNGLYYLAWGGGTCEYATSASIKGPYTHKGVICNQWRDVKGNLIKGEQQHPGIACFSGHWYFASAWGAPDNKRRQIFMEYLHFNEDGTIRFVVPSMEGVSAPDLLASSPEPVSAYTQIEAANFSSQSGVQTEPCSDVSGGLNVGWIENGSYARYSNVNFGGGASIFQARVASANSGGNIEIRLDSVSGLLAGTCNVTGTGAWQNWVDKSCAVSGASGKHDLYLKFTGGTGILFNISCFKFIPAGTNPVSLPVAKKVR